MPHAVELSLRSVHGVWCVFVVPCGHHQLQTSARAALGCAWHLSMYSQWQAVSSAALPGAVVAAAACVPGHCSVSCVGGSWQVVVLAQDRAAVFVAVAGCVLDTCFGLSCSSMVGHAQQAQPAVAGELPLLVRPVAARDCSSSCCLHRAHGCVAHSFLHRAVAMQFHTAALPSSPMHGSRPCWG